MPDMDGAIEARIAGVPQDERLAPEILAVVSVIGVLATEDSPKKSRSFERFEGCDRIATHAVETAKSSAIMLAADL